MGLNSVLLDGKFVPGGLRLVGLDDGWTSRGTRRDEERDLEGHTGNIQHRNKILPPIPPSANLSPPTDEVL